MERRVGAYLSFEIFSVWTWNDRKLLVVDPADGRVDKSLVPIYLISAHVDPRLRFEPTERRCPEVVLCHVRL